MGLRLNTLVDLQLLAYGMEQDLGISDLSYIDKKVLFAIVDLTRKADSVATKLILEHPLTHGFSRPSFFRALNHLEDCGKIAKVGDKRGHYAVCKN